MNRNMSKDVEKKKPLKYLMIDDDDAKEEIFACQSLLSVAKKESRNIIIP